MVRHDERKKERKKASICIILAFLFIVYYLKISWTNVSPVNGNLLLVFCMLNEHCCLYNIPKVIPSELGEDDRPTSDITNKGRPDGVPIFIKLSSCSYSYL